MTNGERRTWKILRVVHPILFFCIALFGLYYMLKVPLVLAIVMAWVLGAVNFAALTWFIKKKTSAL